MLATTVAEIGRRKVVVDNDITGKPGAGIVAFEQIVREQHVLRKAAFRDTLEDLDIVDPFAGVTALAVEILIYIGACLLYTSRCV